MSPTRLPSSAATVLPDLYALVPLAAYPAHVARIVRQVVAGDKCDVTELDLRSGEFRVLVDPEPAELAELAEARRAYMPDHPLGKLLGTDLGPHAYAVSDVLSRRAYRRMDLYGEFFRPLEVEDQLAVGFVDHSEGVATGITVDRDRRGFTDRDRAALAALQPHLAAARRNAVRLGEMLGRSTRPEPRLERLSDREREVLAEVATGATNAQVAFSLGISEGTVRKHLEHILQALAVSSRTAAAAMHLTASAADPQTEWTATISAYGAAAS